MAARKGAFHICLGFAGDGPAGDRDGVAAAFEEPGGPDEPAPPAAMM